MKRILFFFVLLVFVTAVNAQITFIDTTAAGKEVEKIVSTRSSASTAPLPVNIVAGSSGGAGTASAANQLTQITRLDSILARIARQISLLDEIRDDGKGLYDLQQSDTVKTAVDEIYALVKGQVPLVYTLTHEETRLLRDIDEKVARPLKRALYVWTAYKGIIPYDKWAKEDRATGEFAETHQAPKALQVIHKLAIPKNYNGSIFVMLDFHTMLGQAIPRQLKDIADQLSEDAKSIIITAGQLAYGPGLQKSGIEPTMEKMFHIVNYDLPTKEEIFDNIKNTLDGTREGLLASDRTEEAKKLEYTNEEVEAFSIALQGLTLQEIDDAVNTNIAVNHHLELDKLLDEKKQLIKRSEILEYVDNKPAFSDVGGLDEAKKYFEFYSDQFSSEAKEFGVEPLRGVLLLGVPGCLSGNTCVEYRRGKRKSTRPITLEALYNNFNQLNKQWDLRLPTYIYSYDGEGKVVLNRLLGITQAGIKETVRVKTTSGYELVLTPNHPVCCATGEFKPAGELSIGQPVLIQGTMKPTKKSGKQISNRPRRRTVETLKFYPNGDTHVVNGQSYKRTNYARLVVESHMNKMTTDELITILKTDSEQASKLTFLPAEYDVHHMDENPMNDSLSNLMVLGHDAHAGWHSKTQNFNTDYLLYDTVCSIEPAGYMMTYDVQMDYPYNNFVANKFIVHNTGKSLLAKAVAGLWKLPLLRLDVGRVMSGVVGSSENRMRDALGQALSMAPCCLWIDEIEKALSGTKSSNFSDSGTLSRVFGTLLTWMEESARDVVVLATANDISQIPPELIRRFNEVFFVDLPTEDERKAIFEIHLLKRNRNPEKLKLDLEQLAESSGLYTGSEIEKSIQEGIARSWRDGKRALKTGDIVGALQDTKPISKILAEKINDLRDWAKARARYASSEAANTFSNQRLEVEDKGKVELNPQLKRKAGRPKGSKNNKLASIISNNDNVEPAATTESNEVSEPKVE